MNGGFHEHREFESAAIIPSHGQARRMAARSVPSCKFCQSIDSMKLAFQILCFGFSLFLTSLAWAAPRKPNIVIILADDLGFGDTGCYGATKIPTPNIDRLGRQGLRFTDAHATSATCTPSRYALLPANIPGAKTAPAFCPATPRLSLTRSHATLPSILKKRRATAPAWSASGTWVWADRAGRIGMARSSPARWKSALIIAFIAAGHRRPRAVRLCGEPSRRRPGSQGPDSGQLWQADRQRADRQGASRTA